VIESITDHLGNVGDVPLDDDFAGERIDRPESRDE
jgi:hypothetical protein